MVTVYRAHGLHIVIFANDHEPAHVHVFGDGEAKINLAGADGRPELDWSRGMKKGDMRKVMQIIEEQQAALLAKWEEIHNADG